MKSMRFGLNSVRLLAAMVALLALALSGSRLNASNTEDVIFNFSTIAEGLQPHATLITDKDGNLYGTTTYGGSFANGGISGNGLVFELIPTGTGWTETVLYEFQGGSDDGANPFKALTMDAAGNLYGATSFGGYQNCTGGCGTVFELSPPAITGGAWTETVLHSFSVSDGDGPECTLALDAAGNLYGTTGGGGAAFGLVFELSPPIGGGAWTETILHVFQGGSDGKYPQSVVFGKGGSLYGATLGGGNSSGGILYELLPRAGSWKYHALYNFKGDQDGYEPMGGLVGDAQGNLYGTTNGGGIGTGTVFKVTLPSPGSPLTETVLYSFPGGTGGSFPTAGLVFDKAGNLYGTTSGGNSGPIFPGTVFQLTPPSGGAGTWNQTVLLLFEAPKDGTNPFGGLVFGKGGSLYGTTPTGGAIGAGLVFRFAP